MTCKESVAVKVTHASWLGACSSNSIILWNGEPYQVEAALDFKDRAELLVWTFVKQRDLHAHASEWKKSGASCRLAVIVPLSCLCLICQLVSRMVPATGLKVFFPIALF